MSTAVPHEPLRLSTTGLAKLPQGPSLGTHARRGITAPLGHQPQFPALRLPFQPQWVTLPCLTVRTVRLACTAPLQAPSRPPWCALQALCALQAPLLPTSLAPLGTSALGATERPCHVLWARTTTLQARYRARLVQPASTVMGRLWTLLPALAGTTALPTPGMPLSSLAQRARSPMTLA